MYQSSAKENASQQLLQQKNELYERWTDLEAFLHSSRQNLENKKLMDAFLEKIQIGIKVSGKDYIEVIKGLDGDDVTIGTRWLQGIVDTVTAESLKIIPAFSAH